MVRCDIVAEWWGARLSANARTWWELFLYRQSSRSTVGSACQPVWVLRAVVRRVRRLRPFHIDAWVVLPDHMHVVWTLPEGDLAFSARWQAIKMGFSKAIESAEAVSVSRAVRGERGVWQRRFWEHCIRDERDYAAHLDYVHFNPVKHGLVASAAAWPYSTFHRAVALGLYPGSWRRAMGDDEVRGERSAG